MSGEDRFPRSAIAVVVVGAVMTLFVSLISDETIVASSELAWAEHHPDVIPADGPVPLGEGAARLSSTGFDVSSLNSEGERLFQVGIELRISRSGAAAPTEAACIERTVPPTVNARTPNRPAAFPGVIDDLGLAEWRSDVDVNHRDQGSPFSRVELPEDYDSYGTVEGVAVDWGDWMSGRQLWHWTVPAEHATDEVVLRGVSLWRSVEPPEIAIACEVERGGQRAALATGGGLTG